jgi:hypothetical protein
MNAPTRAFVAAVVACGAVAFAWLLATWDPSAAPAWPALVFGPLALASVSVSPAYRGSMPSAASFQLGTAFVFALFLVSGPAPAAIVAGVMSALDWAGSRRSPVVGAFNLGQLFASAGVGAAVALALARAPAWSGLAGIVAFSTVNHALTHVVVSLSGRRPLRSRPESLGDGVRAEILCIACGIIMGLLWRDEPWHALLGAVPLLSYAGALRELSRRREALDRRERELSALENVAATLAGGSRDGVRGAITRDVARSFDAAGALLAVLDAPGRDLRVVAATGVAAGAPSAIPVSRFADGFFETRAVRRIDDLRHDGALYPELGFLGNDFAGGALAVALHVGPGADGLLIVVHGPERRPFDDDDARRLGLLARLVEPALRETAPP